MMAGYVDEGRQVTSKLNLGMRFHEESQKFEFNPEAHKEDLKKPIWRNQKPKMARVSKDAMNSINPNLSFTTESQEDFTKERLLTLDFSMWIADDNTIQHTYYQKDMKTPYVIMERSGTSYHQKFQILSNELVRRLSNVQIEILPHHEIETVIEQYTKELKTSGYSLKQSRELVTAGIRGWQAKHEKRRKEKIPFYRLAPSTIEQRLKKDLLEKENWYKSKEDGDQDSPSKPRNQSRTRPSKPAASWKRSKKRLQRVGEKPEIKSVIFIPHTRESELAKIQ